MSGLGLVFLIFWLIIRNRQSPGRRESRTRSARWFGKGLLAALWLLIAVAGGPAVGALLSPLFLWLLVPFFIIQHAVVPLGLPRVTYWMARFSGITELYRSSGISAFFAVSSAQRGLQSRSTIDWIEEKLARARSPGGAGVVAAGLIASLRGDCERACSLLFLADGLSRTDLQGRKPIGRSVDGAVARFFTPRYVRTTARDWLVADAASRGDWHSVISLGRRGRNSFRWSYAIARMVERLLGEPHAGRNGLLIVLWAGAPRRRQTLPLLRRALARPRGRKPAAVEAPAPGNLAGALGCLASVVTTSFGQNGRSLASATSDIDRLLDSAETRVRIAERLVATGARQDPGAIASGVKTRLADWLDPIIEEAPHLIGGGVRSPLLIQATEKARKRLFNDIEARCRDGTRLAAQNIETDALITWEMWATMRNRAERLTVLAPEIADSLFQVLAAPMNNFAVFQQQKLRRKALAHEIYSWLYNRVRQDTAIADVLLKNIRNSR
jgi:hypothetical protein